MRNFIAFLAQTSVVAAVGISLPWLLRLQAPRPLLRYWQALLALICVLPAAQYLAFPAAAGRDGGAGFPLLVYRTTTVGLGTSSRAEWLIGLVALGICLRFTWIGMGLWRLGTYRRRADAVEAAGAIEVRVCAGLAGPVSFGVRSPVILVPGLWWSLTPEQRALVIRHESIHVRRRDWMWHLAEEAILAVLWFHPASWYVVGQIRMVREQVVDAEVMMEQRAPEDYIQALLACVGGGRLPAPCFARKHELVVRIQKLKQECSMSKLRAVLTFAGVAVVLLAGERAAIWSFPLEAQTGTGSGKVYKIGKGITPPRLLSKVDPNYTDEARDAKVSGTVVLSIEINPDGLAQNIVVTKGLEPGLDRKAVEAVTQWRFSPAVKDGELVTVAATLEVNFRLK